MQSKNIQNHKIQTRPIEDLLGRIRALRQQGQQTITIPAAEADRLADSLSQVMTRLVTIQEEMIDVLKSSQESQTINIEMDGGNFSQKK
jgi:type II secretory pathway component PulM